MLDKSAVLIPVIASLLYGKTGKGERRGGEGDNDAGI